MTIKHEAFIDLEEGLAAQLVANWDAYWLPLSRKIGLAADDGDFDEAVKLATGITMDGVYKASKKILATVGMASMLLGASRITKKVADSHVAQNPPTDWVANAQEQAETLLTDAAKAVRETVLKLLHDRDYAESAGNSVGVEVTKANARRLSKLSVAMQQAGGYRAGSYMGLAANMQTSRLASAGFLLEATSQGLDWYEVSEVMDKRTCDFCRHMDGQTFSIPAGMSQIARVMSTASPSALRVVAPWPNDIGVLEAMSTADMVNGGLNLPPYHPGCRGIIVPSARGSGTQAVQSGVEGLFGAGAAAGVRGLSTETTTSGAAGTYGTATGDSGAWTPGENDMVAGDQNAEFDAWLIGLAAGAYTHEQTKD